MPPPSPTIRVFAARESGVHTIPDEEGARTIGESLAAGRSDGAGPMVWMDVLNPGAREAAILRDDIGFHPLAVEDCVRGRQRPKLDRYSNYLFLVLYAASINAERNRMALNEIHVFLGSRFIVTVHDYKVDEVGEILVADLLDFERVGRLAPVPMPGGDQAVREPWRMAAVQLAEDRLLQAVRDAVGQRVLLSEPDGYRFRYPLIREVLQPRLLPGERTRWHRRYAETLAAEQAAHDGKQAAAFREARQTYIMY